MPHIILEYSNNLVFDQEASVLFESIHHLLARELPTQLSSCKSRSYDSDSYRVGDGQANNAFAHLGIKVMPGRTEERKAHIAQQIMDMMYIFFQTQYTALNLQLSIEMQDLDTVYLKK